MNKTRTPVNIICDCPIYELGLRSIITESTDFFLSSENPALSPTPGISIIAHIGMDLSLLPPLPRHLQKTLFVSLDPHVMAHFLPESVRVVAAASPKDSAEKLLAVLRSTAQEVLHNGAAKTFMAARKIAWAPLSRREAQALALISEGRTHDQAARTMGISRHTVDTYVKRARRKFQIGNKAELTRLAIYQNLTHSS